MARYTILIQSDSAKGRDEECARWLDTEHLPETLGTKGFISAQRYDLVDDGSNPALADVPRTLVQYEIETDDLAETLADGGRRRAAGEISNSDVVDRSRGKMLVYRAASPVIHTSGKK